MLRRLTVAVAVACAAALILTSTAVAQAATSTLVDATGDVWAQDTPRFGQNTQTPQRRQGDIVRTVMLHKQHQVVIRTRFAKLDRVGRDLIVVAQLRTNTGMVRAAFLRASPRPGTNGWRGDFSLRNRDGSFRFQCATRHRVDFAADVVVMRVPRSCLGDPRTVQGSFATGTVAGGTFFIDNPSNQGPTAHFAPYTAPIHQG